MQLLSNPIFYLFLCKWNSIFSLHTAGYLWFQLLWTKTFARIIRSRDRASKMTFIIWKYCVLTYWADFSLRRTSLYHMENSPRNEKDASRPSLWLVPIPLWLVDRWRYRHKILLQILEGFPLKQNIQLQWEN